METSTAVWLPPVVTDDRAPPTDWRIRERISHGYHEGLGSVLHSYGLETRLRSTTLAVLRFETQRFGSRWDKKRGVYTMNIQ